MNSLAIGDNITVDGVYFILIAFVSEKVSKALISCNNNYYS